MSGLTGATVIADSMAKNGIRISTIVLNFPGFIFNHVVRPRELIYNEQHHFLPSEIVAHLPWVKTTPESMGDVPILTEKVLYDIWDSMRAHVFAESARAARTGGEDLRKEVFESVLNPFRMIQVLGTSTSWSSVLAHWKAVGCPEATTLAAWVQKALDASSPAQLGTFEGWHLPYITTADCDAALVNVLDDVEKHGLVVESIEDLCVASLQRISAARCSLITAPPAEHITVEELAEMQRDEIDYYKVLCDTFPRHSPECMEHQATPDETDEEALRWRNGNLHGNLIGWIQFRQVAEFNTWRNRKVATEASPV